MIQRFLLAIVVTLCAIPCIILSTLYIQERMMVVPKCKFTEATTTHTAHSSAGCIIQQNDKLVMIRQFLSNKLALPGGTAEDGESAACTAHRETFEETGIDVTVIKKLYRFNNGFTLFLCQANNAIDYHYSKLFEVNAVTTINPALHDEDEYRFPEQKSVIVKLYQNTQQH